MCGKTPGNIILVPREEAFESLTGPGGMISEGRVGGALLALGAGFLAQNSET